ncbi:efflux RND transporter permease subunit, partial [Elusimicrobiota bacterium]
DQSRLRSTNISLLEVVDIIKSANMAYPAGTIKKRFFEYLIRTMGEYETVDEIRDTPVRVQYYEKDENQRRMSDTEEERPKGLIFLSDIGTVTDTFQEEESIFRHNDKESISIAIKKQSGTNVIKVTKGIRKSLKELEKKLPAEYKLKIIYDQSEFVEESIAGVANSAVQGSILAFFVLLFFLRNFKNSLIVSVTIPVSLIGTFILMYFQKITINMMSLGGLALGVGMLVDNAIVVLENIYRYAVEEKTDTDTSAIKGTSEVGGAITSSTLTTITVFFPFIFLAGVAGQLFKELAYTVTFSLLTSLVVAVTLVPRLAAGKSKGTYSEPSWAEKLKNAYGNSLKGFLNNRIFFYFLITAIFVLSIFILLKLNKEFIPQPKQNQFIMKIMLSPGTRLETTDKAIRRIEDTITRIPEVGDITTSIGSSKGASGEFAYSIMGPNQAEIMVQSRGLKNFETKTIEQVKDSVSRLSIEGEIEYVTSSGILGSAIGGSAPVSIEIMGEEIKTLLKIADKIESRLKMEPHVYGIKKSFKGYRPELKMKVNKDRATLYNISTENVTVTAQTAIKGYVATKFKEKDEQIDVRLTLRESDRKDFDKIGHIIVHSPLKFDVELEQLVTFSNEESSSEITRKEGQRVITVTSNFIGDGLSKFLDEIDKDLQQIRKEYIDYPILIAGERERMKESFTSLLFVIILSLVFVYMIMASQFESLWQPFIIIFTVPLSIIGVALFLALTGSSLNVVVLLGITMLGGIVVNNGIVLISHYNILNPAKEDIPLEKLIEGSATRLRPVLMTALTTTLGLIPMAISGGQGAELRTPLAITVIGGLLVSTFLTLFVIPAVFLDSEKIIKKIKSTNFSL